MKTRINISFETTSGEYALACAMNTDIIDNLPDDTFKIQTRQEFLVPNGLDPNGNENAFSIISYCRNFYIGEWASLEDILKSEKLDDFTKEIVQKYAAIGEIISHEPVYFILATNCKGKISVIEVHQRHMSKDAETLIETDGCFPSVDAAKIALRNMYDGIQLVNDGNIDLSDKFPYSIHFRELKKKK